ncbi:MAG: hypothetical protein ACJ75G_05315 [Gaiellaceae bacterium]
MKRVIRPALVALAIAGALLVAGGIAYATIPDASGVIHGCYKKSSPNQGTLRIIDTDKAQGCSNSEIPLNWSQTGPQGPQGQQGPEGPTGPSDVWSVDGYESFANLAPAQTWVNLATTSTLPAGSYSVQAEAEANSTLAISTDYGCDLVDSSTNEYQLTSATGSDAVTIPVQAVITLASPDTISLRCIASVLGSAAYNWKLAAIKVGTVH